MRNPFETQLHFNNRSELTGFAVVPLAAAGNFK